MRRTSLTQFLIERQRAGRINADLRLLIETIARACKAISTRVNKGALGGGHGDAGTENVQGEMQKNLDVMSNEILLEANEWGGNLAALVSEEMEDVKPTPTHYPRGEYLLLFDPLDGSSNIDVNISVGTIFSVLRCPQGVGRSPTRSASCSPGRDQVAAGFAVYGPTTQLVHHGGRRRLRLHARPRDLHLRPDAAKRSGSPRTPRSSRSTPPTCAAGKRR